MDEYVGKTLCLMFFFLMFPYPWRFYIFICCSCDVYLFIYFHFYLNVIFFIVISMVLSIKVVFFGKEGISADRIEDVEATCWGYRLI